MTPIKCNYTLYLWETDAEGAFAEHVYRAVVMETIGGEYVIHAADDVHYAYPMSSVRYVKEEPLG